MKKLQNTYTNPVQFSDGKRHTNPDPFVLRWCGKYYCYATDEHGVKLSISEDLVWWEVVGYVISEQEYHNYWAPSVLYRNGRFYMYYSNTPAAEEDCHQEHLKLAVADRPEGPFVYQKTFFDQFSIDSHPVVWNGELHMLYSVNDWTGAETRIAGTCILADRMKNPYEFEGNPRPIVLPSLSQEIYAKNRFGDGRDWYTIEGACPLVHYKKCWMFYSANAYENVDYFVGTAVAECKEDFGDMRWEKYPNSYTWAPLIHKNMLVEGTGHNTVAKAPNMVNDWIVYHGRSAIEERKSGMEQREMRIDPLYFSGERMICDGPSAQKKAAPALPQVQLGTMIVTEETLLGAASFYYVMEAWLSAKKDHIGARYGIYLDYADGQNYTEIQIYTGRRELRAVSCRSGVQKVLASKRLPQDFDYTAPHLLRVQRNREDFEVLLDEGLRLEYQAVCAVCPRKTLISGRLGIAPYFSEVTVHSLAVTSHAQLQGSLLQHFGDFYEISDAEVSDQGLCFGDSYVLLEEKDRDAEYMEEFLLSPTASQNAFGLLTGEETLAKTENHQEPFSVYCVVSGDSTELIINGEKIEIKEKIKEKIYLNSLNILYYEYTKI